MNKKILIGILIVIALVIIVSTIFFYNHNFEIIYLEKIWGLKFLNTVDLDILYESEHRFKGDGDKIFKIESDNLNYNIDCNECYIDIEDDDIKIVSDIVKRSDLDNVINISDLEIIESIKKNKTSNGYFQYLIITFDESKEVYYIFKRKI